MNEHRFKRGDRIKRADGVTATVEKVSTGGAVYAKDFSNHRRDGEQIIFLSEWEIISHSSEAGALAYGTADLHIFEVKNRLTYQGKTVLHDVIASITANMAKEVIKKKAKTDLPSGATYRAIVRFWDGDVNEYTFTVKQPADNIVAFTA